MWTFSVSAALSSSLSSSFYSLSSFCGSFFLALDLLYFLLSTFVFLFFLFSTFVFFPFCCDLFLDICLHPFSLFSTLMFFISFLSSVFNKRQLMQEYVDVAQANRHWSISAHHDKLPVPVVKSWKQGLTRWLIKKKNQTCLCSSCRTASCLETLAHEPNTHFSIWDVSPRLCAHVIGSEKSHWELCAPSHGLPAWSSTPVSASHGLLNALQGINTWAAAPAAPGVPGHPCLPVYSSN